MRSRQDAAGYKEVNTCLLYTSDAADEGLGVDLGGRRIIKKKGEIYKAELIEAIPENEDVSIYFHGEWHDLCRGPHLSSTGKIGKYFKLTKVSGAYWRGDSNNEMLQRIYGTCLLYTSPSPRDRQKSRMPSSA